MVHYLVIRFVIFLSVSSLRVSTMWLQLGNQEAMPEIMDSDSSLRPCSVPESHPHVKQLHARFSFGFSNCAGCQFHLACRSEDQAECISRIVQLRSSQAVAMEGLPESETDHVETREAQSYLEDTDVTSSPAGIFHTAPATLPFSSTPRPPIRVEEAQPSREIVQRNLQLPEELLSALLDEPKVPEPLVLQHVWLHLPPVCPHYHRCLLQVDKLGLSLRPLGRSRKAAELHPISGLKVLQTESLSFPLSSILDVEEVFELLPPWAPWVFQWNLALGSSSLAASTTSPWRVSSFPGLGRPPRSKSPARSMPNAFPPQQPISLW